MKIMTALALAFRRASIGTDAARIEKDRTTWMKSPGSKQPFPVPAEYRSLHKYLYERYANTVVLTFAEIEDLLGFALPELARLRQEWWANADADITPSAQSRSWIQASRSAKPNLSAQTVVFERA